MVLSRDGAHRETIVLAWPQMCSVCHGGDAAKGWCCALKILYNNNTREHGKHGRELYNDWNSKQVWKTCDSVVEC